MKGRDIHALKMVRNKEYLRKRIGVKNKYQDVYLTNNSLRGKVDEVLTLENGNMAPLDYKFAKYKDIVYNTYKTQIYCYALLIEENYNAQVKEGFLVYVRSNNKIVKIEITENDKQKIRYTISEIVKIIDNNIFPKATMSKKRCVTCTYRNLCIK